MRIKVIVWFTPSRQSDEWEAELPDGLTKDQIDAEVREMVLHDGLYDDLDGEIDSFRWEAL